MRTSKPTERSVTSKLLFDVAGFQVKLLLDALRDLALSPLSLAAAALDLLLARWRTPTLFYAVLKFGEQTEPLIDLWSAAKHDADGAPANVDSVLRTVADVIRDPRSGNQKARVLKRWAEMNLARAARSGRRRLDHERGPEDPGAAPP